MTIRQNYSIVLGIMGLMMLPGQAAARGQQRLSALAADQLIEIRDLLVSANRAEVTLLTGAGRTGKIQSVTATQITINTRARRNQGPWQLETIATSDIRQLRVFHTPRRSWKSRVGRTLGIAIGLTLAGPVVQHAAEAGHGFGAWAAIIGMPTLGGLAGERLARRPQETIIPVLTSPTGAFLGPAATAVQVAPL